MARGKRLKKAREMLKISSEELGQKVGFSRQSISYWENGRQSGLSYEGATICVEIFKEAGLDCDLNWIWSGKGDEPYWVSEEFQDGDTTFDPTEDHLADELRSPEITLFMQHTDAVVMLVKHNDMKPFYQKDDWIGGYWQRISPKFLGQPCIVSIENRLEVRFLKRRSAEGYHLCFTTYSEGAMEPFEIIHKNLDRIAPIVRLWR
jgi:transcriptional regulator with XRE-family HTH domain